MVTIFNTYPTLLNSRSEGKVNRGFAGIGECGY
jgi:hypothetical protein